MAKKFFKGAFIFALIVSGVLTILLYATDTTYLIKGVKSTYLRGVPSPEIDDHQYFDVREVAAPNPQPHYEHPDFNKEPLTDELAKTLKETRSVAFIVFYKDSMIQEHYWDGFGPASQTNTFSASKTVVTLAAQKAIELGLIESWDQKAMDFLPELKGRFAEDLTIRHLSTMTGGLDWDEHYSSPFTITAKSYYTDHLEEVMLDVAISEKPGEEYYYQSGSTQMLALCVRRATGQDLTAFVSEHFWKPLGAEEPAVWHLDDEGGVEIAYCCMNTNARDFGRFGIMANHNGNWRGKQIIDPSFYSFATTGYKSDYYGHSYWIDEDSHGTKVFYMRGREGQYVISIPEKDLVIVRLGYRYSNEGSPHKNCFHIYVDEVLKMYDEPAS